MGDPKFCRRKYERPQHPWEGERIKRENELLKKFGLKNKKELWKGESMLRSFRARARMLQAKVRLGELQATKEMKEMIDRLMRFGMLNPGQSTLDDVLALDIETVLSRRLQTIAYLKGLSYSPKQARQFIVHGHISVKDRKVTIPGYLVKKEEEDHITYSPRSPIAHDLHPARPKEDTLQIEQAPDAKGGE
ncbi:MAG: 30S ribosomal protein S4 [Candidatus Thermoplasmatota archaeon]